FFVNLKYIMTTSCSDNASHSGCCQHKVCPADHYAFLLRSGAANVVGPKICFDNKMYVLNNVGWGLNIVLLKGKIILKKEKCLILSFTLLKGLLNFLKMVQAGNIILVASYEDPTVLLTDEIREIFAGMGSTMIRSVKYRDSWVFAGAAGMNKQSLFEKLITNDEKTNAYGAWPEMGEVGGCFPRKI
uniref:Si:dkeyp-67f1.2 n=1 Tax=Electrophorus electricus TaxID=8005 RepID=A0A4W4H0I1_ELEEL